MTQEGAVTQEGQDSNGEGGFREGSKPPCTGSLRDENGSGVSVEVGYVHTSALCAGLGRVWWSPRIMRYTSYQD